MVRVAALAIGWIRGAVALVWVVLAFRTKRTKARSGGLGRLVIAAVVLALIASRAARRTTLHRHVWAPTATVSALALVFVLVGAAFAIWARLTIGTNWSGSVTLKENHELIERGP